ncbi:GTP cyclohydrolase FolE2 [Sinomonas terrae]|uniref:GTP cyclohydrolase FolE2 n=1 Tax=Sinomonas terrae TaxID=2908838 RepID=A0ABS9U1V8_9MICC|nr:GTP cyclohydrolase FolE2 [Sinomonas terrae]MCH6470676.1 GTP cyclohydrolase FolE2 [Sinomonas terrae]
MRLPDIQDELDNRGVELAEVGVTNVRYPTEFSDGVLAQSMIGSFDVLVRLPADRRGTHMSRMVQLIHEHMGRIDPREFELVMKHVVTRMEVEVAQVSVALPIATRVMSPATGLEGFQVCDASFHALLDTDRFSLQTRVKAEVTSLCPCSKAISDYGAHNQRSEVVISITGSGIDPYPMSVTDIVDLIRSAGSCPVYPIVKRPDERLITMQAFDRPAFAEDIVRELTLDLRSKNLEHSVRVRNLESIHSHDAVACLDWSPNSSAGVGIGEDS